VPTLSWILETAEDRFYERGGDGKPRQPPSVQCPICGVEFGDAMAASWHVSEAHPLERPLLLVAGHAAPSRAVYAVPLDSSTVVCANTTGMRATVNGLPIASDPAALAAALGSEHRAVFHIELENSRAADEANVRATYAIVTAVPDELDLEAVDRLFAQHLAVDRPTLSDVREFADAASSYTSADRYADGLVEYVLAILAKERNPATGATLPFEAFQVKLQRALAELGPHRSRPIPAAVCATAELNLNDVRAAEATAGEPVLDGALLLFRAIANGDASIPAPPTQAHGVRAPVCPIDRDTYIVLRAYEDLYLRASEPDEVALREYAARAEDSTLSAFDRTKLRVMVAARLLSAGERAAAVPHFDALVHDPLFGRWAQNALEELA
jgi:hypothetical protein